MPDICRRQVPVTQINLTDLIPNFTATIEGDYLIIGTDIGNSVTTLGGNVTIATGDGDDHIVGGAGNESINSHDG